MNKEVLISIKGLQYDVDEEDPVEVISVGDYYRRNGKHYLRYDEISEDHEGVSSCTMKFRDKQLDIIKLGPANVHMVFEEGVKTNTMYHTPFGEIQVGILTNQMEIKESEDEITVKIHYSLDINYAHLSECEIDIVVKPRKVNRA